ETATCVGLQAFPALVHLPNLLQGSDLGQLSKAARGVMVQFRSLCFEYLLQLLESRRIIVLLRCRGTSGRWRLQRPATNRLIELAIRMSMPGCGCAQAFEEGESLMCATVHFD